MVSPDLCGLAFVASLCIHAPVPLVRADGDQPIPAVQRAILQSESAFYFDFSGQRGPEIPILISVRGGQEPAEKVSPYFLFGTLRGISTPKWPLRWDVAEEALYCTQFVGGLAPWPAPPGIYRYPVAALVRGPDDGRWPLDNNKIPPGFQDQGRPLNLDYGSLAPLRDALQGFHRGWKEGKNYVGDPAKVVHYDIRALDDTRIELYMSADGELSRWLFNGTSWKNLRHYDVRVTGNFLVFGNGKSLVTDQDGRWSIVRDIEKENATCDPLVDRVEGEPLTLVEDRVEQKNFFLHGNVLLDDTGREFFTARAVRDHTDRLRKVIDFVVSGRAPQP